MTTDSSRQPPRSSRTAPDASRRTLALKKPVPSESGSRPAAASPSVSAAGAAGRGRPAAAARTRSPAQRTQPPAQRAERGNTWRSDAPPAPRTCPQTAESADTGIRLNKRLADLGLCSRREADDWIARGWVRVNGAVATTGQRVSPDDRVMVEKAAQGQQAQRVTILLHKPVGYVSGQPEDGYQAAASLIGPHSRWREDRSPQRFAPQQLRGLAPAGRLDIDSTGLLVLTQDGRVARQLIGEDSTMDKEYLVRVEFAMRGGVVSQNVQQVFPAEKLALLRHGLSLDGKALQPAQVDWQNPEQLRFVLVEGKKRQIRRMCEAVGLKVTGLKRIRIGRVVLGNLPVGQWRYLAPGEGF